MRVTRDINLSYYVAINVLVAGKIRVDDMEGIDILQLCCRQNNFYIHINVLTIVLSL